MADALRRGLVGNDRWLADAVTAAAARNDSRSSRRWPCRSAAGRSVPDVLRIVERVAEHWARGGPADQAGGLLASLRGGPAPINEALLRGMARGWPKGQPAKLDQATAEAIKQLAMELPRPGRGQLIRLVSPWGNTVLASINAEMAASLLTTAKDESLSEQRRIDAAKQLVELRVRERRAGAAIARPDHAPHAARTGRRA